MKTYGCVMVHLQVFSTSALDGSVWSVSRPDSFTPRERGPGIHHERAFLVTKSQY